MKRYIKFFENFEDEYDSNDPYFSIHEFCEAEGIINYTINSDGYIDVDDDVVFYNHEMGYIFTPFNRVDGGFDISGCELHSLENSPIFVSGDFNCSDNKLTSFYGAPKNIGGDFICNDNPIYSFEHFPDSIGDYIVLPDNLDYLYGLFNNNIDLIPLFGDYNIIKGPISAESKPRLKVSNLNKFLTDNDFEALTDDGNVFLRDYYDLK